MSKRDDVPEAVNGLTRAMIFAALTRFTQPGNSSNGCILWTGHKSTRGYGRMTIRRKTHQAHRMVWLAKRGAIPPGQFVCHSCDVPACVNATHLFLGTQSDNMKDQDSRRIVTDESREIEQQFDRLIAKLELMHREADECLRAFAKSVAGLDKLLPKPRRA
jgi:hypothetical protein